MQFAIDRTDKASGRQVGYGHNIFNGIQKVRGGQKSS